MLFIKENKKYNPNTIQLIFSIIVALVFTATIIAVSSKITANLIDESIEEFDSYCDDVATSYSESIELKLETYFFGLDTFIKSDFVINHSDKEIQKMVSSLKDLNHPDFMNVSFVNLDGTGFAQNNSTYNAKGRDYYKAIVIDKKQKFVSSPIFSYLNSEPIIIIASAVNNEKGDLKGFFTASIKLSTFNEEIKELIFDEREWIIIIDERGRFICHPDQQYVLKTHTPVEKEYAQYSSVWVANQERGHFQTTGASGQPVTIFIKKIPYSNWTMGLSVPDTSFKIFQQREVHYRIVIVIIGLLVMVILFGAQYYFLNLLHRHQHLETIYDPLTTLSTRKHFENEATKYMRRNQSSKFIFLECDIREFRFIYQNYGEEASDNMIFFFSRLLNKVVMRNNGLIGRGFADHFYVLIRITSVRRAMAAFKRELETINKKSKEYAIPFKGKFGISFVMPEDSERSATIQELIGQASFAKTTIQGSLLSQYAIYNSKLLHKIKKERFIEAHMVEALNNHEFYVMYQPKISLTNDKIVGAEALVRWHSPKLGQMMPDSFIPLFERNGFITQIDFFVYEEVFKFLERQIKNGEAIVPISVNMSRTHSKPDKFMHDFLDIFKRYSIPSNLIQIEILERSVMGDQTLKEITDKLHKEGFTVAMDDFGSGQSSLNMLTKIPIDVLKFDREFLSSSTREDGQIDKASAQFIEILIEMSKVLNKRTVFEGVETETQRDFLRSINCDVAQGYFYSKPLTEQDFIEFIKKHS